MAGVFLGSDFVTVTKEDAKDWMVLKPAILGIIMEHFAANRPVVLESDVAEEADAGWISLFDGKTTFGWTGASAESGQLTRGATTASFGNCELRADVVQGGTLVVPGHGRISNESEVVDYRDMVTIVRDRIKAMIERGRTLDQIKAAAPTLEYDGLYGGARGRITPAAFIEAVHADLVRTVNATPARGRR